MTRKDIIISIFIVALGISLISNVVLLFSYPQQISPRDPLTLVVATSSGPHTLEIVDCWDSRSEDVLGQVIETLFTNDLNDPNLPRINLLAESYWWENSTTLQIKLREGILFHDDTPFNAYAAKWNLDRLQYLINATGANSGEVAHTRELWLRPDKKTPIINNTATVGEFNITITLNGAYGPFLNTLTLINAGMISPTSHASRARNFLALSDKPIGTGPFIFDHYTADVEVFFLRWNEYWNHAAYFQKLQYKIFEDATSADDEFQSGKVDIYLLVNTQTVSYYEGEEHITVKHYTDDTGIPSLVYQYIGFNNRKINQTWRKAMSFAINYSYIIDVLREGHGVRANSPISPGFGLPYNESAKGASLNLTKAREIIVSMGFGDMGWTDAQWVAVATSGSPFLRVSYYYNVGNIFRENLFIALIEWFKYIGVEVYQYIWDPWDPLWYLYPFDICDYIDTFAVGWAPDYLDPFNMLDPLVNPNSNSNCAHINDTTINNMMALALETTDDLARNAVYKNIQSYMTEEGYFHVPLYHSKLYFVHSADLRGVPYNAMGKFQAHGIWRI